MVEITLYNQSSEKSQNVTINSIEDLDILIKVYFDIEKEDQMLILNGKPLTNFNITDLSNHDILLVDDKNKLSKNSDEVNSLDEHMDIMFQQSQICHDLVYLKAEYNDIAFKIMIDSGAQVSIMSESMMKTLELEHYLDKRTQGVAHGVGTSKILGSIIGCNLKLNNKFYLPVNFKVIENSDPNIVLLGVDFLYTYNCMFNFKDKVIEMNDIKLKFLDEFDKKNLSVPYNCKKEKIKLSYNNLIERLNYNEKMKYTNILLKIVNNILCNPTDDKYKKVNLESKLINENISESNKTEFISFMNKIGFTVSSDKKILRFTEPTNSLQYTKEILCS